MSATPAQGTLSTFAPAMPALRIIAYVVAVALIWELAWLILKPPDYLLPPLHSVLLYFSEQWPSLLKHSRVTAYETLLGFACAVVGGIAGAYVLQRFPRAASLLWPSVLFAQITPKVAIAPLLLLWLGFGIEFEGSHRLSDLVFPDAHQRICGLWVDR